MKVKRGRNSLLWGGWGSTSFKHSLWAALLHPVVCVWGGGGGGWKGEQTAGSSNTTLSLYLKVLNRGNPGSNSHTRVCYRHHSRTASQMCAARNCGVLEKARAPITYTHSHTYIHTLPHVHTHTPTHTHSHTYPAHAHSHMHTLHVHTPTCTHSHTYTLPHAHTPTHTHTPTCTHSHMHTLPHAHTYLFFLHEDMPFLCKQ